jgi:hypothetical protein
MEYKGDIKGFPEEVVAMMMKMQEWQTGKRDITVFENDSCACDFIGGFDWAETPDGFDFWETIILDEDFDRFFKSYPRLKHQAELIEEIIQQDEKDGLYDTSEQ